MKIVRNRKYNLIMLAISIGVILLSALFGSFVQTAGWSASVEDLRNVTNTGTISLVSNDSVDGVAKNYTVSGSVVSGILFIPKNATKETPAPAVVFTHGLYNNREMQLQNAIEAVRRGYVVLTIDRDGHGHNNGTGANNYGDPLLSAAKYLYNLTDKKGNKIVDGTKIAVSGHSMGGSATNGALAIDGVDTLGAVTTVKNSVKTSNAWAGATDDALKAGYHMGIISAGIVQANNAANASYGSNLKGVAIVKAHGDEFFFNSTLKTADYVAIGKSKTQMTEVMFTQGVNGTYSGSEDGNIYIKKNNKFVAVTSANKFHQSTQYYKLSKSANSTFYLQSKQAMDFVGVSTATWTEEQYNVVNGGIYDFKAATDKLIAEPNKNKLASVATKGEVLASSTVQLRAVYEAYENHPMNHFSTKTAGHIVDFLYNTFGVAEGVRYKAPTNQTWWMKEVSAVFGILALFALIICLVDLLLKTKAFASLAVDEALLLKAPELLKKPRKHVTYWLAGILTAWFSYYSWGKLGEWGKSSFIMQLINDNTSELTGLTYTNWSNVNTIAYWGVCSALFAVAVTAVIWFINRIINMVVYKDDFLQYDEEPFAGFRIRSAANVFKTIGLVLILVIVFFGIIQIQWDLLVVDFRIWTFAFRVFKFDRILSYLRYLPFFFMFYMVNAAFAQNYRVKDLPEWATTIINVVFNVGWLLICVWAFNDHFIKFGASVNSGLNMQNIWAYPIIPSVAIATVVARRLYLRTGNAWVAGLFNAVVMTFVCCAGTSAAGLM